MRDVRPADPPPYGVPLPGVPPAVFLDFDGTVVDFAATPDGVVVDAALRRLVKRLAAALDGALAIVSGRSIAALDRLFAPLALPAAGSHGAERRPALGAVRRVAVDPGVLEPLRAELAELVRLHPPLLLEDKGAALALHFRRAPQLGPLVRAAFRSLQPRFQPAFECIEGDAVVEIRPAGASKAHAVEAFLREAPFKGRLPVFIGDDRTDLDGFAAVRARGGMAISVGPRVSAAYHLPGPPEVRQWLAALADSRERLT